MTHTGEGRGLRGGRVKTEASAVAVRPGATVSWGTRALPRELREVNVCIFIARPVAGHQRSSTGQPRDQHALLTLTSRGQAAGGTSQAGAGKGRPRREPASALGAAVCTRRGQRGAGRGGKGGEAPRGRLRPRPSAAAALLCSPQPPHATPLPRESGLSFPGLATHLPREEPGRDPLLKVVSLAAVAQSRGTLP